MKISNKIIEEAITDIAGEDVVPLVKLIKNKKNVSEFKIAESLKEEVNLVRNKLYRLYHANLVSFTRRKDKKKGWYIYYWTFRLKQVKYVIQNLKKQRLEKLKERLKREKENSFFMCSNTCMRLDFERAIGFEFKCPECGELMNQEQNEEKIKEIESDIKKLEKEIGNK